MRCRWKASTSLWFASAVIGGSLLAACGDSSAPVRPPTQGDSTGTDTNHTSVTFSAENLGVLPGHRQSFAFGINAAGDVAGYSETSSGATHPVLWIAGAATDLGVPFGPSGVAYDVNDARTVVGYSGDTLDTRGVVWKGGSFTLILAQTPRQQVIAYGLNNANEVVGTFIGITGLARAFRYTSARGLTNIHPSGGYVASKAFAISDQGTVVGEVTLASGETHAAMWSAVNSFTDLGTLGGLAGTAFGVNASGAVVGESEDATRQVVPFVWRAATGLRALAPAGSARDISDLGRIVGYESGAVLAATRLSASVVVLPLLPNSTTSKAFAVNRCGSIAGTANILNGTSRAVRWVISRCD